MQIEEVSHNSLERVFFLYRVRIGPKMSLELQSLLIFTQSTPLFGSFFFLSTPDMLGVPIGEKGTKGLGDGFE